VHATAANPDSPLTKEKAAGSAALLVCVYIFMLYSRVFEATMLFGLPNIYLMFVLSGLALITAIFKGGIVQSAKTRSGMLLLLFTVWASFILPFSSWRSESLHQLTTVWLKSLAAFFIVAGLTTTFAHSQKVFAALGYGAAASTLLVAATNRYTAGRETSLGSLGNANEVAFHIGFGLPFLVLLISRVKVIYKIPLAAVMLLSLALSFKTASRGGLIITAAIVIVAILKVSFANKFKIIALGTVGVVIGLLAADKGQLERYQTIFHSDSLSAEGLSAQESAENRKHKLLQSLQLTLQHPWVGVGMGVFVSAAADMSKQRGEHPDWLASHNSYTEISSETGVVGFLIISAVFVFSLGALLKLHRTARRLNLKDVQSMALCMLLSAIALAVHFFFDAIAYSFYLPMVAALGTSLVWTTRPVIQDAEAALKQTETTAATRLTRVSVIASTDSRASARAYSTVQGDESAGKSATKNALLNPYKLGRRRAKSIK
jgi:O-antigen ligase